MKTFLFIFLAGYAVKCDDNYYVVQVPDTVQLKDFKVYWNVPTMQCKSKKIPFNNLFEKYGIIQNTNDRHRGDKISILYDPGFFPALVKNESTGEIRYRNGGVPQQGDLMEHLKIFKNEMEKSIPDKKFNGVGIIDFESWRPVLRQNFGILTPYKDVSYDIEKKRHWWWKKPWIQEEARRRFEAAGREFMQTTLALATKMRPQAIWGYYGYPQCFNRPVNGHPENCAKDVPRENDKTDWLWSESTALYPSVYSTQDMSSSQLAAFIRGRVKEAARVRQEKDSPILPYWWFRYRDGGYFNQTDLDVAFSTFYKSSASGFIVWGSSKDVNTVNKCNKLMSYLTNVLGPAIAKYTKPVVKIEDIPVEISPTTFEPQTVTKLDPEYHWVPPENYTQNIEHIVEQELLKQNYTNFDRDTKSINESVLLDIILNNLANYDSRNCRGKNKTGIPSVLITTKNPFSDTTVTADDDIFYDYADTSTVMTTDNSDDEDVPDHTETISVTDSDIRNYETTSTNGITDYNEVDYSTSTTSSNNNENSKENFGIYDVRGTHLSLDDSNSSSNNNDLNSDETSTTENAEETVTENWEAIDYILNNMLSNKSDISDVTSDGKVDETPAPATPEQVSATLSRATSAPAPVATVLLYLVVIYVRSIVDVPC